MNRPPSDQEPYWTGSERRRQRVESVANARCEGVVVLEDIFDPHNAAAVFRSADAFGFHHVALVFQKQRPFNPYKIGKTVSSSANKWLNFEAFDCAERALHAFRERGFTNIATSPEPGAQCLVTCDLTSVKPAIWLGNERDGLSARVLEGADLRIRIPMVGMVESFNLSVSAAILLYEIYRQRSVAGIDAYLLPPKTRQQITRRLLDRALPRRWRRIRKEFGPTQTD